MQKAKNQIEAFFIFAQDSNYSKAYYAGLFEILGSWKLVDTYLEGIKRVTPEDIQAVARKYFSRDNRTVGILIPTKKAGSKQ
jgi:zinc protease